MSIEIACIFPVLCSNRCRYSNTFVFVLSFNDNFNKNSDILKIAEELNIKKENIFYTQSDYKWQIIKKLNINIHFFKNLLKNIL
jgi:hypothetical protein